MLRKAKMLFNKVRFKFFWSDHEIGSSSHVGRNVVMWAPKSIKIGDNVYLGSYSRIGTNVEIGNGTLISSYVSILGKYDHNINDLGRPMSLADSARGSYTKAIEESVYIGTDVWIGHRVTIISGVTIADGSIIGAGSTVTHSTLPYGVYAGCPAKFIKWRFESKDDLKRHLEILKKG